MKKHTRADGSKGLLAYEQEQREWKEGQLIVTRCAACRMTHRGTVVQGRNWHETHRKEKHPELSAVGRRVSKREQRENALRKSEWRRKKTAA